MSGSRIRRTLTAAAAAALLTASGVASHAARAAMGTGGVVTESMNAGPYSLTLRIGPLEKMYTQAQVKKSHPKSGEVMLRGSMVMGGMGIGSSMPNHHLEVHVYTRSTHTVVTNAMVAITVETPSGKVVAKVPIAVMRGVDMGASDTHYGNNVALKDGKYLVAVQVEQTHTAFMVTVGPTSMTM